MKRSRFSLPQNQSEAPPEGNMTTQQRRRHRKTLNCHLPFILVGYISLCCVTVESFSTGTTGLVHTQHLLHHRTIKSRKLYFQKPKSCSCQNDEQEESLPRIHQQSIQSFHNDTIPQDSVSVKREHPTTKLLSRRSSLQSMVLAAATAATATTFLPSTATAGKPELDTYGNLFTPKSDMLRGGSEAARGIATRQRGTRLKPGQALQSVYETRFIAYLSRFLLNFDPAANAWWLQNGLRDSWETSIVDDTTTTTPTTATTGDPDLARYKFAEFAESVEVGLADYFVGPYGSYSSVQAAKAGILASAPAPSSQPSPKDKGFLLNLLFNQQSKKSGNTKKSKSTSTADTKTPEKNGVLNLYSLLKARYTSVAAKRQLAILFSFISLPSLQPTQEIKGLLGEADNATISEIVVLRQSVRDEEKSRTSSRRGGGYSINQPPEIVMEAPPALGDDYQPAELRPIMKPTSRVLRIQVLDPGEGYTSPPQVTVMQGGIKRACQACAIIDRRGHVAEVLVLDSGYGYGGRKEVPPKVRIAPPNEKGGKEKTVRKAEAVADLEYEVVDIQVVKGGNGYVRNEPPNVLITPPAEDPDWFLATQEQPEMRMIPVRDIEPIRAEVTEMRNADGNIVYSIVGKRQRPAVNKALIERLRRDPLELLPSNVMLEVEDFDGPIYKVSSLPPIPPNIKIPSPRYRAYDPIFGGVGSVPVTKGALALSASEYARLALSGAVCTVLVRTALNPLELIKTKQQLKNDEELFDYARDRMLRKNKPPMDDNDSGISPDDGLGGGGSDGGGGLSGTLSPIPAGRSSSAVATGVDVERDLDLTTTAAQMPIEQPKLGTFDLIFSLAELRGLLSLFQSADITFLASLVFGSFGFGATELFRRSFTEIFFSEGSGSGGGSEVVLLLAAALATVVTSAAATPFEVLRVKSMILLDPVSWTQVLQKFLDENGNKGREANRSSLGADEEFRLSELNPRELLPLWSGFAPTLSRELPFAIAKFLAFDILARAIIDLINSQTQEGALPIQVGVGPAGLAVSAIAGAVAGVAGAIVSHPADLILTYTSASKSSPKAKETSEDGEETTTGTPGWVEVVKELLSRDGGVANLFLGLPARATFFFLVIGLQFFLYDYVKNLFQVGTDDLSLVLDVFYAVRAGLLDMD